MRRRYVSRAAWGATPRGATRSSHPIGSTVGVTLHYEGPRQGEFPHSACAGKVRGIQAFHKDGRGWADIAYNLLVCPHGYVYEGRGVGVTSAANGNTTDNGDWYAVCYLGGVGDGLTEAGQDGLHWSVTYLRDHGAGRRVNGHRDHKATACPGDAIYSWLQGHNFDTDLEDDMSANELLGHKVPVYGKNSKTEDGKRKRRPLRVTLAQTHNRAAGARQQAAKAARIAARCEDKLDQLLELAEDNER